VSNPSLVIVLLEDARHRMFVYRYLIKRRLKTHQIRIVPPPSGQASADGWVRKQFPDEVTAYRVRQARTATALIVVIDADTHTVQDRWRQLDQALKDARKYAVDVIREQIARLVPKRNIETWILCLNGQAVDEDTDYKRSRDDWTELIPEAAETLSKWTHQEAELPKRCIDSLRSGVSELNRLTF
jgi:hypothetical protein